MPRITQDDKDKFKKVFDNLIDDLQRTVTLHLAPSNTDCPNCIFNPATRRSSNRKDPANPNPLGALNIPFSNGATCPVCHGVGRLQTPRSDSVIATISKRPDEFDQLIRELGRIPENVTKVRTKLDTLQSIREAKSATIDGLVYDKLMPEITQGLGDLQFVKSFWEQRSNKSG